MKLSAKDAVGGHLLATAKMLRRIVKDLETMATDPIWLREYLKLIREIDDECREQYRKRAKSK